jgi:hypothetical protein
MESEVVKFKWVQGGNLFYKTSTEHWVKSVPLLPPPLTPNVVPISKRACEVSYML